ncbi:MAG: hypothetical protein ACK6DF_17935, partial [Betaproteobacteria bacterium]
MSQRKRQRAAAPAPASRTAAPQASGQGLAAARTSSLWPWAVGAAAVVLLGAGWLVTQHGKGAPATRQVAAASLP